MLDAMAKLQDWRKRVGLRCLSDTSRFCVTPTLLLLGSLSAKPHSSEASNLTAENGERARANLTLTPRRNGVPLRRLPSCINQSLASNQT